MTFSPVAQAPRSSVKLAHKLDNSRESLPYVIDSRLVGGRAVIRTADSLFRQSELPADARQTILVD